MKTKSKFKPKIKVTQERTIEYIEKDNFWKDFFSNFFVMLFIAIILYFLMPEIWFGVFLLISLMIIIMSLLSYTQYLNTLIYLT